MITLMYSMQNVITLWAQLTQTTHIRYKWKPLSIRNKILLISIVNH